VKTDREELSWAAGFFDGEGNTNYQTGSRQIQLKVPQTDPTVLYRFLQAVRQGKVCGPYPYNPVKYPNAKPRYVYQTWRFEDTQAVIAILWFKLSRAKRIQARREFRRFYEHRGIQPYVKSEWNYEDRDD